MNIATCKDCKRDLPPARARLVVDGGWICHECEYRREFPHTEPVTRPRRHAPTHEQRLFDPRPYGS